MFEVHKLNARGLDRAEALAMLFRETLDRLQMLCYATTPNDRGSEQTKYNARELALVRTHLEIASFYAKRAMALCPENQA